MDMGWALLRRVSGSARRQRCRLGGTLGKTALRCRESAESREWLLPYVVRVRVLELGLGTEFLSGHRRQHALLNAFFLMHS